MFHKIFKVNIVQKRIGWAIA